MQQGDIYMVGLDPTQGHEQAGHRPVLVVSASKFNAVTKLPIIAPITNGGAFAQRIGFAVALSGTQTTGVVRCDQLRTLDLAARSARRVEAIPHRILAEVLARVRPIFQ